MRILSTHDPLNIELDLKGIAPLDKQSSIVPCLLDRPFDQLSIFLGVAGRVDREQADSDFHNISILVGQKVECSSRYSPFKHSVGKKDTILASFDPSKLFAKFSCVSAIDLYSFFRVLVDLPGEIKGGVRRSGAYVLESPPSIWVSVDSRIRGRMPFLRLPH